MKNIILKYTLILATILALGACKDDAIQYADVDIIDPATIDSIALMGNHTMLVADGYAQLDLRPFAFNKNKTAILDVRLKDSFFEYTSDVPGLVLNRKFSTKDANLIGKTITVQVKVKGTNVTSKEFTFTVMAPLQITETITIPIVFHIAQTTADIASYGGSYSKERIDQIIERVNNSFSGVVSKNPAGINTKIVFKLATHNTDGSRMNEPGIHRVVTTEIEAVENSEEKYDKNSYDNYIVNNNMMWSPEKYMNVWLMSDRGGEVSPFGMQIGEMFVPAYHNSTVGMPEGMTLVAYDNDPATLNKPSVGGVIYRLQSINELSRSIGNIDAQNDNDLIHYIGRYLGILPTYSIVTEADDYCADTQNYLIKPDGIGGFVNTSSQKTNTGSIFGAENIMDDPSGAHRSVTADQYKRVLWVLNNCPERAAWKSTFAFTGR